MAAKQKIWVTKYALTSGVFCIDAVVHDAENMACYKTPRCMFHSYVHGNDFHLTEEAAKARFEVMKAKKKEALLKGMSRLESTQFAVKHF